ncbi:MAG: leucine--tRNA ligase [Dehalococcoidia bacterium]|nr:leucine--tRNA ligase [Dehalococcoidia bacterium]
MVEKYNPIEAEPKWQKRWEESAIYHVDDNNKNPKWYALTMFPYTSGDLHIGHWYAMAPSDVYARFKRMQGYNVLHPIGFDAFGLPAENAAIKRGIHPKTWTMSNVENMRRQLKSIGAIYDWDREVITCLPEYYKWTQWFFLKLWQFGLAYRAKAPVNWCPNCQAVLANEQVVNGGCWRCETLVVRRDLEQWFFRITKYADELMRHDELDWPERIKLMQANWVGRSEGVEISFVIDYPGVEEKEISVFTTRPDTIYGVTFMVLAPEHPLVQKITTSEYKLEVETYIENARRCSEIERLSTERKKEGVFTGAYAINRLNGDKVPIWIADYVLLSYGTGAVMAVPAHDERDFVFAERYRLPVKAVVVSSRRDGDVLKEAFIENGLIVNSGHFNGMESTAAKTAIAEYVEQQGWGRRVVSYKLRDWLVSRQRYWGAPIPAVYCDKCGIVPVPEKDLPVLLPDDVEFKATGESPLKYCKSFVDTNCPNCGEAARRETDTMDTFMCSSWYFMRYTSPHFAQGAFDTDAIIKWMPTDIYTGGAEHAVMHLFYSRFFLKALRDMGLVHFGEPFKRLFNQGTVTRDHQKMSKSKGNVVNPDKYVSELGADTVRAYLMFIGPWEQGGDWDDSGIMGLSRWLGRIWSMALDKYDEVGCAAEGTQAAKDMFRLMHQTIRSVTEDMDRLRFNTMISSLMEYSNYLAKIREAGSVNVTEYREAVSVLLRLLAPTAPHFTEEVWSRLGYAYSIHNQRWPEWDSVIAQDEEILLVVQVNGKVRDKVTAPAGVTEDEAKSLALNSSKVQCFTAGKTLTQVVYVPGKLVNIVMK